MLKQAVAIAIFVALGRPALPQSTLTTVPPSDNIVTLKTRAELVTVPVVVTDKSGAHVHGLKKEDFEVLEDGKAQKIATFEEITQPDNPRRYIGDHNTFSNVIGPETKPVNLTILVVDLVNTPFEDQAAVKDALVEYLAKLGDNPPPTSIMAITRYGLKVVHDFATDPKGLATALRKTHGETELVEQANQEAVPRGTPPQIAAAIEMMRKSEQSLESLERRAAVLVTLQAMRQIAQSCVGLPGRKTMIWASSGFPFTMNEPTMILNIGGPKLDSYADISDYYEKTWRALNQAQVAIYPVGAHGLSNPTLADVSISNPRQEYYSHSLWMYTETTSTFKTFADSTGGRAFYNTNDLKSAFEKAIDDNRSYYMLSYYLENRQQKKQGWHKLAVRVARDGIQIRARNGFFLLPGKPDNSDESEMKTALTSPLNYTGIPITGRWQQTVPAKEAGKKTAVFLISMPANFAEIDETNNNHMLLQFAVVALTVTGTQAGSNLKTIDGHPTSEALERIRTHSVDYRGSITVPPGEYTVRIALQDRLSGRMGSVSTHLKVDP